MPRIGQRNMVEKERKGSRIAGRFECESPKRWRYRGEIFLSAYESKPLDTTITDFFIHKVSKQNQTGPLLIRKIYKDNNITQKFIVVYG